MSYRLEHTPEALDDLKRLFSFLEERDQACAFRARQAIERSLELLCEFPWSCRKSPDIDDHRARELIVDFGHSGYVCLFYIMDDQLIWLLGVRHQSEAGYSL